MEGSGVAVVVVSFTLVGGVTGNNLGQGGFSTAVGAGDGNKTLFYGERDIVQYFAFSIGIGYPIGHVLQFKHDLVILNYST